MIHGFLIGFGSAIVVFVLVALFVIARYGRRIFVVVRVPRPGVAKAEPPPAPKASETRPWVN